MFLGDSGTHLLAFVVSYIIIKSHNLEQIFSPEEIFIILSLPGLDMFRLFLFRIIKGKNPFKSDRNHIHHLILRKMSLIKTFLLIQFIIIINILLYYYFVNKLNVLFLNLFSYIVLFLFFSQGRKKIETVGRYFFGLLLSLILLPLLIIVAIIIKFDSHGPVFLFGKNRDWIIENLNV